MRQVNDGFSWNQLIWEIVYITFMISYFPKRNRGYAISLRFILGVNSWNEEEDFQL